MRMVMHMDGVQKMRSLHTVYTPHVVECNPLLGDVKRQPRPGNHKSQVVVLQS